MSRLGTVTMTWFIRIWIDLVVSLNLLAIGGPIYVLWSDRQRSGTIVSIDKA